MKKIVAMLGLMLLTTGLVAAPKPKPIPAARVLRSGRPTPFPTPPPQSYAPATIIIDVTTGLFHGRSGAIDTVLGSGTGTPCTTTAGSLQFNNSAALGCATDFVYSAPHTLTVGAAGILVLTTGASLTGLTAAMIPNSMTTLGDMEYGGASGVRTRLVGSTAPNDVPRTVIMTPTGGAATAPVYALPGYILRAVSGDSATIASTDCGNEVALQGANAATVALPTPATLAVPLCAVRVTNDTSGTFTDVTLTPATYTMRQAGVTGLTTMVIPQGSSAVFKVDPQGTSWNVQIDGPIYNGTFALNTSAISVGTPNVTDTAVAWIRATDTIICNSTGALNGITGYVSSTDGTLGFHTYTSAGHILTEVYNNTATDPLTPQAVNLICKGIR